MRRRQQRRARRAVGSPVRRHTLRTHLAHAAGRGGRLLLCLLRPAAAGGGGVCAMLLLLCAASHAHDCGQPPARVATVAARLRPAAAHTKLWGGCAPTVFAPHACKLGRCHILPTHLLRRPHAPRWRCGSAAAGPCCARCIGALTAVVVVRRRRANAASRSRNHAVRRSKSNQGVDVVSKRAPDWPHEVG
jgi:hypothetical protein